VKQQNSVARLFCLELEDLEDGLPHHNRLARGRLGGLGLCLAGQLQETRGFLLEEPHESGGGIRFQPDLQPSCVP